MNSNAAAIVPKSLDDALQRLRKRLTQHCVKKIRGVSLDHLGRSDGKDLKPLNLLVACRDAVALANKQCPGNPTSSHCNGEEILRMRHCFDRTFSRLGTRTAGQRRDKRL